MFEPLKFYYTKFRGIASAILQFQYQKLTKGIILSNENGITISVFRTLSLVPSFVKVSSTVLQLFSKIRKKT